MKMPVKSDKHVIGLDPKHMSWNRTHNSARNRQKMCTVITRLPNARTAALQRVMRNFSTIGSTDLAV